VATCKPTFGKLSTEGVVPVSRSLDHPGPMACKAGDLAVLLDCLLGATSPRPMRPSSPPRLGAIETSLLAEADEAVRQATRSALEKLARAGAEIRPLNAPRMFADVMKMHRRIMAVEAAAYHQEAFAAHRAEYGPMIASLLEEGLATTAVDYVSAKAWHREFRRLAGRLLDGFDALVMPSTHTTAPPTLATTGTSHFQSPWSLARLPVVSFPCGLAADRMPAGIQLVGRRDEEAKLLRTAAWCEQVLGFDATPALLEDGR
jgi:aspartyl-tRNA(Asn)/glutamyl-tRNA(Gln) amidotransferase subunit A